MIGKIRDFLPGIRRHPGSDPLQILCNPVNSLHQSLVVDRKPPDQLSRLPYNPEDSIITHQHDQKDRTEDDAKGTVFPYNMKMPLQKMHQRIGQLGDEPADQYRQKKTHQGRPRKYNQQNFC